MYQLQYCSKVYKFWRIQWNNSQYLIKPNQFFFYKEYLNSFFICFAIFFVRLWYKDYFAIILNSYINL